MNGKNSQLVAKYLVVMIISVIVFLSAINIGCEILGITDKSTSSFFKLVEKLNSVPENAEGHVLRMNFELDEDDALVGFAKKENDVIVYYYEDAEVDITYLPSEAIGTLTKPDECKDGCICICNNFKSEEIKKDNYKLKCGKIACKKINHDIERGGFIVTAKSNIFHTKKKTINGNLFINVFIKNKVAYFCFDNECVEKMISEDD